MLGQLCQHQRLARAVLIVAGTTHTTLGDGLDWCLVNFCAFLGSLCVVSLLLSLLASVIILLSLSFCQPTACSLSSHLTHNRSFHFTYNLSFHLTHSLQPLTSCCGVSTSLSLFLPEIPTIKELL